MIEVRAANQVLTNKVVAMSTNYAALASSIPSKCNFMLFYNPDTSINILLSFDAGTTAFTLKPGSSLSIECADFKARNAISAKSASATPNLEMIFGAEV